MISTGGTVDIQSCDDSVFVTVRESQANMDRR